MSNNNFVSWSPPEFTITVLYNELEKMLTSSTHWQNGFTILSKYKNEKHFYLYLLQIALSPKETNDKWQTQITKLACSSYNSFIVKYWNDDSSAISSDSKAEIFNYLLSNIQYYYKDTMYYLKNFISKQISNIIAREFNFTLNSASLYIIINQFKQTNLTSEIKDMILRTVWNILLLCDDRVSAHCYNILVHIVKCFEDEHENMKNREKCWWIILNLFNKISYADGVDTDWLSEQLDKDNIFMYVINLLFQVCQYNIKFIGLSELKKLSIQILSVVITDLSEYISKYNLILRIYDWCMKLWKDYLDAFIGIEILGKNVVYTEDEVKEIKNGNYDYTHGYESDKEDEKYGIEGLIIENISIIIEIINSEYSQEWTMNEEEMWICWKLYTMMSNRDYSEFKEDLNPELYINNHWNEREFIGGNTDDNIIEDVSPRSKSIELMTIIVNNLHSTDSSKLKGFFNLLFSEWFNSIDSATYAKYWNISSFGNNVSFITLFQESNLNLLSIFSDLLKQGGFDQEINKANKALYILWQNANTEKIWIPKIITLLLNFSDQEGVKNNTDFIMNYMINGKPNDTTFFFICDIWYSAYIRYDHSLFKVSVPLTFYEVFINRTKKIEENWIKYLLKILYVLTKISDSDSVHSFVKEKFNAFFYGIYPWVYNEFECFNIFKQCIEVIAHETPQCAPLWMKLLYSVIIYITLKTYPKLTPNNGNIKDLHMWEIPNNIMNFQHLALNYTDILNQTFILLNILFTSKPVNLGFDPSLNQALIILVKILLSLHSNNSIPEHSRILFYQNMNLLFNHLAWFTVTTNWINAKELFPMLLSYCTDLLTNPIINDCSLLYLGSLLSHIYSTDFNAIPRNILSTLITRWSTSTIDSVNISFLFLYSKLVHLFTDDILIYLHSINVGGDNGVNVLLKQWISYNYLIKQIEDIEVGSVFWFAFIKWFIVCDRERSEMSVDLLRIIVHYPFRNKIIEGNRDRITTVEIDLINTEMSWYMHSKINKQNSNCNSEVLSAICREFFNNFNVSVKYWDVLEDSEKAIINNYTNK